MSPSSKINPPSDVSSPEDVIKALYEAISFAPGNQPDYHRLQSLYHPDATISPPRDNDHSSHQVLDIEGFLTRLQEQIILNGLDTTGFSEREVHRTTQEFGEIVHIFSTYESRSASDNKLIGRGINSIQLIHDDERWWVLSIMWERERDENPLPQNFLP